MQLRGWTGTEFLKEIEIYNLLGDPILQIWTSQPPGNSAVPTPIILTLLLASSIAAITIVRRRKNNQSGRVQHINGQ